MENQIPESYKHIPLEPIGLNAKQAANYIGVSLSVLWKLEAAGAITSIKLNRRKIFSVKKLQEFVNGETKQVTYQN